MIFSSPVLTAEETDVIGQIEEFRDKLKLATRQARRWKGILLRGAFARAIQGSNAIEGYNVTYEDAVAAIENEEPLEADQEAWEEIKGYRDAMTYVLQLSEDKSFVYGIDLIKSLHFMMLKHTLIKHPGRWRPGYIYVMNEATGERVYEGPDIDMVPQLIDEFVSFLNSSDDHPIIKAAMAHLNLTMIHPFSDGNGRMARVLQSLVLSRQGIIEPEFCSIEEYLGTVRSDYYRVLGEIGKGRWHPERDSRPWIRFCLQAHFRQGQRLLRRTKEYERVWAELEAEAKKRGLPDRTLLALFDAAFGFKVRNATYRKTAEITENLASRDLKNLTDQKLLIAKGQKRGRFYVASDGVLAIRANTREQTRTPEPEAVKQLWLPGFGS
jgi:Fic family protein